MYKIDIINKIDYKTLKFFEKIINAVGFGTLFYAQSLDEYHKNYSVIFQSRSLFMEYFCLEKKN